MRKVTMVKEGGFSDPSQSLFKQLHFRFGLERDSTSFVLLGSSRLRAG